MKSVLFCLTAWVLVVSACSKDEKPINGPDPVGKTVFGKWILKDISRLDALNMAAGTRLFDDTVLYDAQMHYLILNEGDTTDRGEFSLGRDSAVNGFDRMQIYDSIVYETASIATVATAPQKYYFRIDNDTLWLSFGYFKDSADPELFARYIR